MSYPERRIRDAETPPPPKRRRRTEIIPTQLLPSHNQHTPQDAQTHTPIARSPPATPQCESVNMCVCVWGWLSGWMVTWLHFMPAAGLAAAARRASLTWVVGLLSRTVHLILHAFDTLCRTVRQKKETRQESGSIKSNTFHSDIGKIKKHSESIKCLNVMYFRGGAWFYPLGCDWIMKCYDII